ncbi:tetratricopeptide repeat protein [Actinomadura sp. WMMA1423]|uniref:tetratricopeptide repeat protein n=1 Tax=Actinomadura sp. WMMA1423 TaxID=2591108 RepID=UPI0011469E4F|nr:tetratricopeptide repeat protein [Actinomadura sp. WMMA1423]
MAAASEPDGLEGREVNQSSAAGRDAFAAGRDLHIHGAALEKSAPLPSGHGVWWPPLGRLPERVRGRDRLLDQLTELLAAPDGRAHVLSGLGGTGKSTVALQLAEVAVQQRRRVWWISAVDAASLTAGMLGLAEMLGAEARHVQAARSGQVPACDVLWPLLEAAPGWLLVIDNADDLDLLAVTGRVMRDGNGWVRGSRSGLLVVTSRDSDPAHWGRKVDLHPVGWLSDADGGQVLRDLAPHAGTAAEAEALSARLGGLALALHHAGSHLGLPFSQLRTFAAYLRAWEEGFAASSGSDRDVVAGTWELSLAHLDRSGTPQARGLLEVLAWFAAPVPIPAAGLDHEVLGRVSSEAGASGVALGLQALLSTGLISTRTHAQRSEIAGVGRSGIVVHPLVAETLRERELARHPMSASAATAITVLQSATAKLDPTKSTNWITWLTWLPHLEELLINATAHVRADDLARLAQIAVDGSRALLWAGLFSTSLGIAEMAIRHCQRLGSEHPQQLDLNDRLAGAHFFLGNSGEAERLYRELLSIQERVLGPEHPNALTTRYEIARTVGEQGNPGEAEHLSRELLPIRERVLGPEHPGTLSVRAQIAWMVGEQGNPGEAERLSRELLPIRERVLGPEHPDSLSVRAQIAWMVGEQGNPGEAERLSRELLPIQERVLGPEHPNALSVRAQIAWMVGEQGNPGEAERLYRELLPIQERVLGPEHPRTLATRRAMQKAIEFRKAGRSNR